MNTFFTRSLCTAVLAVALLTSCSRPVAYFQRGLVDPSATSSAQTTARPAQGFTESSQSIAQAQTVVDAAETYARQDNRLSTDKVLGNRMTRISTTLTSTAGTRKVAETTTPHKLTGVERLLLRKVSKQISKQLAPNHPEKALLKKGKLIGSVVLLIAGLLMLIFGSGTLAFIGLIVSLVGAVGVIVSLIGIDS